MDRYTNKILQYINDNNIRLCFEEYAALKQEVLFNTHKKEQSKGNK